MTTIANIEQGVVNRLEQNTTFWSLADEIRVGVVEAMFEASLITGYPEVRDTALTAIAATQTLQSAPSGAIALIRIDDSNGVPLRKTTLWDMDRDFPGWEAAAAKAAPQYWFPVGLTQWGVYPKVSAPVNVRYSYIATPVTSARPYTGAETVPYLVEYQEGLESYAANMCRLKEATAEWLSGFPEYDLFLAKCAALSKYADRIGSLRFSFTKGAPARISEVAVQD